LFIPSVLSWNQKNVTVSQTTTYPVGDSTKLVVTGEGNWAMKIRIPAWTSGATVSINGKQEQGVEVKPGTYSTISRSWKSGDTVTVTLPMKLRTLPANDNPKIAALAYGPVVLSGNYGSQTLGSVPSLALNSVQRVSNSSLDFTAKAGGKEVDLGAFYDAHGFNYNVYWNIGA
jgi:DUF1680 family protein